MKTRKALIVLFVILGMLSAPASAFVGGQPPAGEGVSSGGQVPVPQSDFALLTLKTILESTAELKQQIVADEHELERVKTDDQKVRVLKELAELNSRIETLHRNFEQIATGVNLETFTAKPREKFDWREEVQDVLEPIVKELKSMTAHPREIESLRGEAAYYKNQIATAKSAVQNVQRLMSETRDPELRSQLEDVEKNWKQKEQQTTSQLAVVRHQLSSSKRKFA